MGVPNRSPYGNYFYRGVNPNATVDDILPSDYRAVGSFHNWRLTIVVGSAPPASVALTAAYQDRRERHPLMNWDAFPNTGLGILRSTLDQYPLPPFIDHYPDEISQDIDDWYPDFDQEKVNNADRNLKQSMREHSKPIALMLGARPTRLVDGSQRNNLVIDRCGQLGGKTYYSLALSCTHQLAKQSCTDPDFDKKYRDLGLPSSKILRTDMNKMNTFFPSDNHMIMFFFGLYALEEKVLSVRDRRTDEPVDFGFTNLDVGVLQFNSLTLDDWDGESRRSM